VAEAAAALAAPATIAALFQLVDYGMSAASNLYKTARNAGAAEQELESLAHRIQLFATTVRMARETLKRHCDEYPQSPVVIFNEHHRVLWGVKKGSKFLRRRLRDMEKRLKALHSSSALWMSIKWAFQRSSFLELHPELGGFQANLSLLAAVANLEAMNILKQSGVIASDEERAKLEDEWCVFSRWHGVLAVTDVRHHPKFHFTILYQDSCGIHPPLADAARST
jgi:hypothetical protein